MLRVLVALLIKGELYDEAKRKASERPSSVIDPFLEELDEVEEGGFASMSRRKPKRKAAVKVRGAKRSAQSSKNRSTKRSS